MPWLVTMVAVAILVYVWVQLYFVNVDSIATGATTQINRNTILSKTIVDYSGLVAAAVVVAGVLYRARGRSIPLLMQEIRQVIGKPSDEGEGEAKGWGTVFSVVVKDVLLLGRMGECEDFQQWLGHFLTMWGFIGLALTTTLDAIFNSAALPLPITDPIRLLGNATGIMLIAGLTISFTRRLIHSDVRSASRAGDWAFLVSLYGTALTGFMVQAFADTSNLLGTSVTYPIHLVFISLLLVAAPWTKFVHALWRPSWVVYTKLSAHDK
ncbi:MAG: respiratory nitrate reductase subunit gamma [Nitrososphaerota archaeon]|jgi:nitrate reductase gamma subunit|nr:respiratory nitrate reductase subunit gamma [Nitrososphaerota archaeon]